MSIKKIAYSLSDFEAHELLKTQEISQRGKYQRYKPQKTDRPVLHVPMDFLLNHAPQFHIGP